MKRSTPILIATLSLSILYTLPVSAIKASEPFIQQEQLNRAWKLENGKKTEPRSLHKSRKSSPRERDTGDL